MSGKKKPKIKKATKKCSAPVMDGKGGEKPCGAPTKISVEGAEGCLAPLGGIEEWKRRSEDGLVCGILGCEPPKETLVRCKLGCKNSYCQDHLKIHGHVVNRNTGKANPGPRLNRKTGKIEVGKPW